MTVYKMTEVVGTSRTSIDDAIRGALSRAGATLDDLQWFEVKEIRGRIGAKDAPEFQVRLDVGFTLHAPAPSTKDAARTSRPQVAAKKGRRTRADLGRGFHRERS